MDDIESVNQNLTIKIARMRANLTIKRMSDLTGIPYKTIQHWEDGSRNPPIWAEKLVIREIRRLGRLERKKK